MGLIRIGGYPMDLALSEGHSFPGEATEYPVEAGADISDHIRELPDEITLECIVSDTPIGEVARDPTRTDSGGTPLGEDLLESRQGVSVPAPLPSADALARLREMKAARRPITVETSLGAFASMAFISLEVPVDKNKSPGTIDVATGKPIRGALFFTAKFKKIVIVTNRRTKVRVRTPMPTGSKTKAVVARVAAIDTTVEWRHDLATGQFVGVVSTVEIQYNRPAGITREEALILGNATPSSEWITYFDQGSAVPITGDRRQRLVADLRAADEQLRERNRETNPFNPFKRAQNLPAGINLDRFQQPAPETLPPPTVTDGDLSRFQRKIPVTFPGS